MQEIKKFNGDFIQWLKQKLDPEGQKKAKQEEALKKKRLETKISLEKSDKKKKKEFRITSKNETV